METSGISRRAAILKKLVSVKSWPPGALSIPPLQAHRGYWIRGEQENTLGAFRAARMAGARMVELDVQLSKDRIPVVFHDENIFRFSKDPERAKARVCDLTAFELKQLVNAPTLAEVLRDSQVPPYFNIELKTRKLFDDPLERKVFEVVRSTKALGRVLFSSFNPLSLWRVSQYTESIPLALLLGEEMNSIYLEEMWLAPLVRFHLLHIEDCLADRPGEIDFWKGRGVPISVWTVNEKKKIQSYIQAGALSVISDEIMTL